MAILSPATQTADKLGLCFEHRHTRDELRWPGGQRYVLRLRLPHWEFQISNFKFQIFELGGSLKAARLGGARRSQGKLWGWIFPGLTHTNLGAKYL